MVPEFNLGGGHWFSLPTVVLSADSGDDVMVYPFNFDSGFRRQSIGSREGLKTICSPIQTILHDRELKISDIVTLEVVRQHDNTECGPRVLTFIEECLRVLSMFKQDMLNLFDKELLKKSSLNVVVLRNHVLLVTGTK